MVSPVNSDKCSISMLLFDVKKFNSSDNLWQTVGLIHSKQTVGLIHSRQTVGLIHSRQTVGLIHSRHTVGLIHLWLTIDFLHSLQIVYHIMAWGSVVANDAQFSP